MEKLKLYYISTEYINYLRQYDTKVFFNKNQTRPYIGVVYKINGINYFAPLASPKLKHQKMNPKSLDIFKIKQGKLGIININNMIPTPLFCLTEVIPLVKDAEYKNLLENQLTYINNHRRELFAKINLFLTKYENNQFSASLLNRCCDFKLLEEKCSKYKMKVTT